MLSQDIEKKVERILEDFGGVLKPTTLINWLSQFKEEEYHLALEIANKISYYDNNQISSHR